MTRIRKALFPVGGRGTRFLPATKSIPKEMLPVIDKPLIQYAVEEARAAGIEEFIFVTGRGKTVIQDHFDLSYELNSELEKQNNDELIEGLDQIVFDPGKICYIRQQMPLGLGHAVWCARNFIGNEPFAVLLADDLIMSEMPLLRQMIQSYQAGENMVAIQTVPKNDVCQYGILDCEEKTENRVKAKGIVEKPSPETAPSQKAVIGRYILQPSIFEALGSMTEGKNGEIQLTDAIHKTLIKKNVPLCGYEFNGKRFDCGSKVGLLEASIAYALNRSDMKASIENIIQGYFFKTEENQESTI